MPKGKKETGTFRHKPLPKQLADDADAEKMVAPRTQKRLKQHRANQQESEGFVPKHISNRALSLAREQRDEEEQEPSLDFETLEREERARGGSGMMAASSDDEDYNFDDEEDYEVEEIELSEADTRALELWMGPKQPKLKLADLIMDKIREKESLLQSGLSVEQRLNPKVVSVYRGVGELLAKYKSGKLPKAFKVIPALANWEEIVYLTDPDNWTSQAVRAATKIFTSNLNARQAQRYFNIILLPKVREDIDANKKLNWHLYMALKKSVFKTAAFYKGIILPLCESRNCTLKEAVIIGSIIIKCSIPSLHSAVAVLKLAEMEYSGANSVFIRILLDKKYALPYRVIDILVTHFGRFIREHRELPVLWNQSLLVFVQRYKELMTAQQKEILQATAKAHPHYQITPEIIRELQMSRSRGEAEQAAVAAAAAKNAGRMFNFS